MMPTLAHIALTLNEASGHSYTAADVAAAARARGLRPHDGRLDEDAIPQVAYELNVMRKAGILPSAPYGLSDDIFREQHYRVRQDEGGTFSIIATHTGRLVRTLKDSTSAHRTAEALNEDADCRCWNEGEWGRVHREDCPIHGR